MMDLHIEPGLFIFDTLSPYDINKISSLLTALRDHKKNIELHHCEVLITDALMVRIFSGLQSAKLSDQAIQRELRTMVLQFLSRFISLKPSVRKEYFDLHIKPNIISEWIEKDTAEEWVSSFAISIKDQLSNLNSRNSASLILTWPKENLPKTVTISSQSIREKRRSRRMGLRGYLFKKRLGKPFSFECQLARRFKLITY